MNKLPISPNNNLSKYNFNLGNTTANNHKNIDRIATFSGGTWVSKDYNADFGGQWCLVDSFLINDNGAMQRIMSTQTNTVLATRYCEKNVWGDWDIGVTKSDLANTDITPTPISGLAFAPATMFKKAGVAYLNLQISNTTSSVISMENGKVIATGLPIPYKKQQVYVEAIPWNNGATGSNASTTPLRLCINNTGQLCSYYPSANEKITPGMPICINMAYPINE